MGQADLTADAAGVGGGIRRDGSERPLVPEVDWARIDATTEAEITAQIAEDDADAMRNATPSDA